MFSFDRVFVDRPSFYGREHCLTLGDLISTYVSLHRKNENQV